MSSLFLQPSAKFNGKRLDLVVEYLVVKYNEFELNILKLVQLETLMSTYLTCNVKTTLFNRMMGFG